MKGSWITLQMKSSTGTSQREFVAFLKTQYPDVPAGVLPLTP